MVSGQLKIGLGMLADTVEMGPSGRERGGELEVLVLEDEEGVRVRWVRVCVEEDVAGGFAGDGEAEGGGAEERESEVGFWVGEGEFLLGGLGERAVEVGERKGGEKVAGGRWWSLPVDYGVWDFPSAVVGVGNSDSQTSACF